MIESLENQILAFHGIALGIDGGAGMLKWVVRDAAGNHHYGQTEGANLQMAGWDHYLQRLQETISLALTQINAAPDQLKSIGMGLSGVDRPAEKEQLTEWVLRHYPALRCCWIGNDALPALRQGVGRLRGIILIAGTGSICVGVARNLKAVRVGGWGSLIGDEGSGFWIGREALYAATQMADGRLRPTPLLGAVLKSFELNQLFEIIPYISRLQQADYKRLMASLTPVVEELARQRDPAARRIIRRAAQKLGQHAIAASDQLDTVEQIPRRLTPAPRRLVCAGGLFEKSDYIYKQFRLYMFRHRDLFRLTRLQQPPTLGALVLGLETPIPD